MDTYSTVLPSVSRAAAEQMDVVLRASKGDWLSIGGQRESELKATHQNLAVFLLKMETENGIEPSRRHGRAI